MNYQAILSLSGKTVVPDCPFHLESHTHSQSKRLQPPSTPTIVAAYDAWIRIWKWLQVQTRTQGQGIQLCTFEIQNMDAETKIGALVFSLDHFYINEISIIYSPC